MPENNHKYRSSGAAVRWALSALGVIAALLILAQLITSIFLDDMLGGYLQKQVRSSTNGAYSLAYEDLDIGILSGSLQIDDVRIEQDTTGQTGNSSSRLPISGKITIGSLDIGRISLWSYMFNNSLNIGSIQIDRPELNADILRKPQDQSGKTFSSVDSSLYAMFKGRFDALHLHDFEIRDARFLVNQTDNEGFVSTQELNLHLQDIDVDSSTARTGRLFLTDNIELSVTGYKANLPQGFYTIRLEALNLSSDSGSLRMDSLQVIPRLPRYEFSEKKGHELDRIDLLAQNITLKNVDYTQLTGSSRFYASQLNADSVELNIFRNKNISPAPKRIKKLPQISFRELPFPIRVDTIRVRNADVAYTEHARNVPQPGTVTFENINATINALSNYPEDLSSGHETTVETRAEVMGKGLLNASFTFFMNDPQGAHTIRGTLDTMAFSALNPVLRNLAFIQINEGVINSLKLSMKLNDQKATGSVIMDYEGLALELLQSETLEQGTGQQIKSFIANTFVVQENNTDPPLRKGKIQFERNRQKSVFNFWWKALSTGLKNSIGL